ncbi:SPOR domain-containing protein [Spiribacter aquaticus]|uniref:SPOR domain-containing protein n=1 Tax=Spiribacter aquaticus TaxID=1935996 RepID=A0A557RN54_9GAMM|nr:MULTISPECIES: SPOR domain-containing protein [Spiribacter]KAF0279576.1 hypothetical protein BA897_02420 [Spiribacter roseus]TVO66538.1 SPOR domain-containing protein [Spiribacter aquaticus]
MAAKGSTRRKPARKSNGQASRPTRARAASGRRPGAIVWGATGLAVGLLVALVVHLEHRRPDAPRTDATADSEAAPSPATQDDQPRFEFYRLLNEQEVEVGERDDGEEPPAPAVPEADPAADPPAAPESDGTRYLLQAGSFRQAEDADSLKASLALLGIQARVQVVELPGGETWHRVRVGPFADLEQVNGVRARMADQQIESILLQAGG